MREPAQFCLVDFLGLPVSERLFTDWTSSILDVLLMIQCLSVPHVWLELRPDSPGCLGIIPLFLVCKRGWAAIVEAAQRFHKCSETVTWTDCPANCIQTHSLFEIVIGDPAELRFVYPAKNYWLHNLQPFKARLRTYKLATVSCSGFLPPPRLTQTVWMSGNTEQHLE